MTHSPGPLAGRVWLMLAAFGWAAFAGCTSDDSSLFGTQVDPSANDAGSGGEVEPASGGTAAKGGSPSTGGAPANGGISGLGGSSASGGDPGEGGADASGGSMMSSGGMTAPGKGGSGGGAGCSSGGKTYPPGASFPSTDGCNTCSCQEGGIIACTLRACAEGGAPGTSCQQELQKELAVVQACETNEDCGVPIQGSSCGCTRDLVANKTADTSRVKELLKTCGLASTCDCPNADGFLCSNRRCAWNYGGARECTEAPVGRVCITGIPISSGDRLEVGMKLGLQARPSGCFSSSCTATEVAACHITAEGSNFTASAEFCLRDNGQGQACTADCGGGGIANCESETVLTEGKHTLKIGGKTLTFQVPSVIAPADACVDLGTN